jgi:hypothetical protein
MPIGQEAGWAASLIWTLWSGETSTPTRNGTLTDQSIARHYTNCDILAVMKKGKLPALII